MLAFTDTEVSKSRLIASLEAHAAADRIVAGRYWENEAHEEAEIRMGGCAVGCSLRDFRPGQESDHKLYEPLFGIPQIIARLEDSIFERLPQPQQKEWPLRFARAVREGADLSRVWDRFALWLLVDPQDGVAKYAKQERTRKSIEAVGALYRRKCDGDDPTREEWRADAAAYAAYAYADADAYAAADAADAAAYAYAYAAAARQTALELATIRQADKLIELIEAC